jgi:hypothetical protein
LRKILALTTRVKRGVMVALQRETRMDAPTDSRKATRRNRLVRISLILLGAVLALGAWQSFGVLMYGIEGSYDH